MLLAVKKTVKSISVIKRMIEIGIMSAENLNT